MKSIWNNKRFRNFYHGSYVKAGKDRVFQLTCGNKVISFESWQAAVKQGWEKLC
jgi:hypothetical protein